ncbi:MAG: IS1380 family transposase, partial [Panacagrimonas sp.]
AFDGGMLSSDAGVLLLRGVERRLGVARRLAHCLQDRRDAGRITHGLEDMLRLRMFAIAAGYEDANDCDKLRTDPVFKMAVGRAPASGERLCSQPTMSRLENAPSRIEIARMMGAMVDQFCASYARRPASIILDIDDTLDAVHGHQQLSLFNAHYDERCFLPVHIYEGTSGKLVAAILRAGKTPSGAEVRTILKHVIARIRRHWPKVAILVRGDSHYGRHEAMSWCEGNGVDYMFGLSGNKVLEAMVRPVAAKLHRRWARRRRGADKLRTWHKLRYGAARWKTTRRVIARLEESDLGLDIRYVVTSLAGKAKYLYETVYCARGQAENFIKLHKAQLASDRTSCRDPRANQVRLILHSAAYWLLHTLRAATPKRSVWARMEFATLRLRLIKIAARVVEGAARIRISLPTACPDAAVFRLLAGRFAAVGP